MGRICSVADVFDALTSKRPYKQTFSIEYAVNEIQRCSGTAFDPKLVQVFLDVLPSIEKIKAAYSDPEESSFQETSHHLYTSR